MPPLHVLAFGGRHLCVERWRIILRRLVADFDIVWPLHHSEITMNARINSSRSNTTHFRFQQNPDEWFLYHTLYREARSTWHEIPFKVFAEWLKRRPDWVVGDFGCGEAELARLVPNKVYSFDHVTVNEFVIACDMIKIGAKVVSHGRYVAFQMAEVAIPRQMFQEILRLIADYDRNRHQRQHEAFDRYPSHSNRREEDVQMPGKMTKSNLRPPFRPPQVPAAVRSSRLSCGKVGKAQIFTSARESSGESW